MLEFCLLQQFYLVEQQGDLLVLFCKAFLRSLQANEIFFRLFFLRSSRLGKKRPENRELRARVLPLSE